MAVIESVNHIKEGIVELIGGRGILDQRLILSFERNPINSVEIWVQIVPIDCVPDFVEYMLALRQRQNCPGGTHGALLDCLLRRLCGTCLGCFAWQYHRGH